MTLRGFLPALSDRRPNTEPAANGNAAVATPIDLRNCLRELALYDSLIAITFP